MKQLEINFKILPTPTQICMMCHFSSECENCCKNCKEKCNAGQICGLSEDRENHVDRLETWLGIIKHIPHFKHLKKFISA